ncbi:helicase-related protein, partial [Streptomyces misionensis]|uniref:helicase-related protein n=1 Tax=Streptomyces misionensis TaxID=67331 RepID=UPI00369B78F4
GLYESAVLGLCTRDGVGPKVVASTATIRRSGEQVRGLYGRDVQLFPPAGLDARHSYFAEPDTSRPGRRYVGVMAQGHTAGRASVATAAAMVQGAWELPEESRDAYWTLVAYHHSLRELGRTVTAAADDIPAQLAGLDGGRGTRKLIDHQVQELTSNLPRAEQPVLLDRLEKPYTDPDSVSFLPCTNMLSVGVDVKRLSLMLMLGQPKTTAEYIQATSRVGRAHPGLVAVMLNANRSRDRSHYENFLHFHSALYREVESTSVTPFSARSRERGLHAVIVALARILIPAARPNEAAGRVESYEHLIREDLKSVLLERVRAVTPEETEAVSRAFDEFVDWWVDEADVHNGLLFEPKRGSRSPSLLKSYDDETEDREAWSTLWSLRDVDAESALFLEATR